MRRLNLLSLRNLGSTPVDDVGFTVHKMIFILGILFLSSNVWAQDFLGEKMLTIETTPQPEFSKSLSFYETDDNSTLVRLAIDHEADRNPYSVKYEYDIKPLANGYVVNPKALMDHLDLYFDEKVRISQEGDFLVYPTVMKKGDVLTASKSKLEITIPKVDWTYSYDIIVSSREVVGKQMTTLENKDHEGTLIKSTLQIVKSIGDRVVEQKSERILELYVDGYGPVEVERGVKNSLNESLIDRKSKL